MKTMLDLPLRESLLQLLLITHLLQRYGIFLTFEKVVFYGNENEVIVTVHLISV